MDGVGSARTDFVRLPKTPVDTNQRLINRIFIGRMDCLM